MESFFTKLALSDGHRYRLGRHLLFWFLCWIFMGFIYGSLYSPQDRYNIYVLSHIEALLYMPQHILLSYGIIYLILPRYFFKGRYWSGLAWIFALLLFAAVLSPLTAMAIINPFREWLSLPVKPERSIGFALMAGLRGSNTIAGFAVAIKLLKVWHLKKVDHERLEKTTLRTELEILKGQLHPHFMFNTLNSIYAMAMKKSEYTPEAILKLSQLMRYMLTECNNPTIELQREVQILHHYMALEKERFGKRLDININVGGDIEKNTIAPLLLMPFLENSFKHGADEMTELAWISVDLRVRGTILEFKLINGKPELPVNSENSSQVGLLNARKRLSLLYPGVHDLRITDDTDAFIVMLMIQLDKIKLPEAS